MYNVQKVKCVGKPIHVLVTLHKKDPKHTFDRIPCGPQNLPECCGKDKKFLAYKETTPGHLTCTQALTELSYLQSCISLKTMMRVCLCL